MGAFSYMAMRGGEIPNRFDKRASVWAAKRRAAMITPEAMALSAYLSSKAPTAARITYASTPQYLNYS